MEFWDSSSGHQSEGVVHPGTGLGARDGGWRVSAVIMLLPAQSAELVAGEAVGRDWYGPGRKAL